MVSTDHLWLTTDAQYRLHAVPTDRRGPVRMTCQRVAMNLQPPKRAMRRCRDCCQLTGTANGKGQP